MLSYHEQPELSMLFLLFIYFTQFRQFKQSSNHAKTKWEQSCTEESRFTWLFQAFRSFSGIKFTRLVEIPSIFLIFAQNLRNFTSIYRPIPLNWAQSGTFLLFHPRIHLFSGRKSTKSLFAVQSTHYNPITVLKWEKLGEK